MQIRLFGCKIYVSLLFLTAVALIMLLDKTGLMLFGFIAVFVHELGHLIVMVMCGAPPDEVIMQPAGILIKRRAALLSTRSELLIASAGITANIALALIATAVYIAFGCETAILLSAANLCAAAFNLPIIKGLDGYDIAENLLKRRLPVVTADHMLKAASVLNIAVLGAFCLYLFIWGRGSVSLMIGFLYLVILALMGIRR